MRVVKSFSLDSDKDKRIIDYYDSISNKSEYIKNLILTDLNNKSNFTKDQREEIKDIFRNLLEEYLQDNKLNISNVEPVEFDEDAIDALSQFE